MQRDQQGHVTAQEQKYISRVESVGVTLRKQEGLKMSRKSAPYYHDGDFIPEKELLFDNDNNPFTVKYQPSRAAEGAKRSAAGLKKTAMGSAVSENSLKRAVKDIAEGLAEAWVKAPVRMASYADDIAQMTGDIIGPDGSIVRGLSAADKNEIIERISRSAGDDAARSVTRAMRAHGAKPKSGNPFANLLRRERMALPKLRSFFGGDVALSLLIGALTHSTDPVELAQYVVDDMKAQVEMVGQGWREIGNLAYDAVYVSDTEQKIMDAESQLLEIFQEQNQPLRAFDIIPDVVFTPPALEGAEGVYSEHDPGRFEDINGSDINSVEELDAAKRNDRLPVRLRAPLAQIRKNVYLGRSPLAGIVRLRNRKVEPPGFNESIAQARSLLDQRDKIYDGLYRDLDLTLRALAHAEDKLDLAEDKSKGDPQKLEKLREAVQQLRRRMAEINDKKKQREQRLGAIAADIEQRSQKICEFAARVYLESQGGDNPLTDKITPEEKQRMIQQARDERRTMSDLADAILGQTELPVSQLRTEMQDVFRLKREFHELASSTESNESDEPVDLNAIREHIDEAKARSNKEQIQSLEEIAKEMQDKALRLLTPWSRQPLAEQLIQRAIATPPQPDGMLPEDEMPQQSIEQLEARLSKLKEDGEASKLPDDAAEVVAEANSLYDEANELQRKISEGNYLDAVVAGDDDSLASRLGVDNQPADIPALLNRFDQCRRKIEDSVEDDEPVNTRIVARDGDNVATVTDAFAALDPTHAFEKQQWTMTLLEEEEEKRLADADDPDAPETPDDDQPEEATNPFEKQQWSMTLTEKDPEKKVKPIIPMVPETTFRPSDY